MPSTWAGSNPQPRAQKTRAVPTLPPRTTVEVWRGEIRRSWRELRSTSSSSYPSLGRSHLVRGQVSE
ncbi:hypothetical protein ANN_22943 [Periplaneta americana]|uniref:Uncharacterized protein n=1 Tax=Periplaneta americana TaxID=6978 RepID=A0ABQ8SJQ0_PERAM|nr:hypothetical protein ANN_22943 [Periplaneta americana]